MDLILNNFDYVNYAETHYRLKESALLITEECHVFDKQYACANEVALAVINCINDGKKEVSVSGKWGKIRVVYVKIIWSEMPELCKGDCYGVNNDEYSVKITLYINHTLYLEYNTQTAIDYISTVIVHELMHGNIFINRMDSNVKDVIDIPIYYDAIKDILSQPQSDNEYLFARMLYLAYYQETQAMISQAWNEVKSKLKCYNGDDTTEDFKLNLQETDVFQDFMTASKFCKKLMHSENFSKQVFLMMENRGISFKNHQKLLNKISTKLETSLKKMINSCYFYYVKSHEN